MTLVEEVMGDLRGLSERDALVHHPDHYTSGDIECIDAIAAAMSAEAFRGYCKGNALKYLWRAGNKPYDGLSTVAATTRDVEKAIWYLKRMTL